MTLISKEGDQFGPSHSDVSENLAPLACTRISFSQKLGRMMGPYHSTLKFGIYFPLQTCLVGSASSRQNDVNTPFVLVTFEWIFNLKSLCPIRGKIISDQIA
jgi:hypothetical protein